MKDANIDLKWFHGKNWEMYFISQMVILQLSPFRLLQYGHNSKKLPYYRIALVFQTPWTKCRAYKLLTVAAKLSILNILGSPEYTPQFEKDDESASFREYKHLFLVFNTLFLGEWCFIFEMKQNVKINFINIKR